MITVICGEDSVTSRDYYLKLSSDYKAKGYEVVRLNSSNLAEAFLGQFESPSLFQEKKIFAIENVNKLLSRRSKDSFFKLFERIIEDKQFNLIIWEDSVTKRELKLQNVNVKEFKPQAHIFALIEACYPGNMKKFLGMANVLVDQKTEMFTFVMLSRHIRNLLLIRHNITPQGVISWQLTKLKQQAAKWPQDKLIGFYDGLYRIDASLKSGKNPAGVGKSIEVLSCYYL